MNMHVFRGWVSGNALHVVLRSCWPERIDCPLAFASGVSAGVES